MILLVVSPVSNWSTSQYVEKIVFVKTTLGVAFHHLDPTFINACIVKLLETWITLDKPFLARRGRMSSERYCHTPGVVVIVVVVVDNLRLKFLFINLSQVKVSVY